MLLEVDLCETFVGRESVAVAFMFSLLLVGPVVLFSLKIIAAVSSFERRVGGISGLVGRLEWRE